MCHLYPSPSLHQKTQPIYREFSIHFCSSISQMGITNSFLSCSYSKRSMNSSICQSWLYSASSYRTKKVEEFKRSIANVVSLWRQNGINEHVIINPNQQYWEPLQVLRSTANFQIIGVNSGGWGLGVVGSTRNISISYNVQSICLYF